ncbi:MAG: hypothetical protein J1E39_06680 [Eubacterium sp.]|nr:hypothetical protein [Eubacterium sp.]
MKKTIAIFAALVMALTAAGCSDSQTASTADNSSSEETSSTVSEESTAGNESADSEESTGNEESTDNGSKDSDFDTWTEIDMINYLKAEGAFEHDDWLEVQEGLDVPLGITKIIWYYDDFGDADVMILWLDSNSPSERTKEIYEEIKTTHNYIMTDAGNVPCPFNALYGRFAILYTTSLDDDIVAKFDAALEKLTTEYGVEPDFFDKDPEMPEYDDYYDDDYFDIDE